MKEKIEIKQVSENEYHIGKNRTVFIDKKVIHITVDGEVTTEMALLHNELDRKLLNMADGMASYLIDLNKSGKNSHEASQMFKKLCYHPKVNKVAIYGLNPVARVIAAFVIGLDIKQKQQFFKTEEQARFWLAE